MRINLLLITLVLFSAGLAHAVATPLPKNMKVVGEAELKVLWLSIYRARLASPQGSFVSASMPLLLTLEYQRDVSKQSLLDETRRQWQKAGIAPDDQALWLRSLATLWLDVEDQDSLGFYQDADGYGHFYHNQNYLGSIRDNRFCQAFLGIWLSDNSDFPGFTRQLTGRISE
ncbi:hypothetical protein [Amphritea pacifica]|uniref:Chalcone isomerase domain-containing protein n=1 Tax=Amphritea pacifica TaxID=2811233 RepID=A0ABS2W731_9GAMM|nr:hypothetical protein [Amphritea pacifica]MBN0987509.1 hypothetical protein [Amphritea pacifica]MBN1005168.1 hypothetical protein [Amphritea pacifica]